MKRFKVSPGFFLMLGAVWLAEPELLAPTLFAATVHEAGHLIALATVGGKAEGFTLAALGAELRLSTGLSYARELPVALAGPLASLVLALAAAERGHFLLAGLSLALGLFNLLPVQPLDGGRAISCLGGLFLSPLASERLTRLLAIGTLAVLLTLGSLCMYAGLGPGLLCMGLWLGWHTFAREKKP